MERLLVQQERLKSEGIERHVAILVDDIILTGRHEDNLSHLCLRGRHFNISVFCCGVSYTTLPKRCRRSLDVLFLFSCPMAGDCEILCREYAQQSRMAKFMLTQLPEWTCLVMETLQRSQRLYHYRVENGGLPVPASVKTAESDDSLAENPRQHDSQNIGELQDRTTGAENYSSHGPELLSGTKYSPLQAETWRFFVNPRSVPVCSLCLHTESVVKSTCFDQPVWGSRQYAVSIFAVTSFSFILWFIKNKMRWSGILYAVGLLAAVNAIRTRDFPYFKSAEERAAFIEKYKPKVQGQRLGYKGLPLR